MIDPENETLEEKHNRFRKAIEEYRVRINGMVANASNTPLEDLYKVLAELKIMRDESIRVEEELLILNKLAGKKNGN